MNIDKALSHAYNRHGEEGCSTQVKQIRVVGIITDPKGEMVSLRQICKTLIPMVKASTELFFQFPSPTTSNIVTFEFLSNYGGVEQGMKLAQYCKV